MSVSKNYTSCPSCKKVFYIEHCGFKGSYCPDCDKKLLEISKHNFKCKRKEDEWILVNGEIKQRRIKKNKY